MACNGVKARSNYALALLVAVTFFMENLDATVITTAIPQMAKDFLISPVVLNVGISAYLLAVAVGIPLSGWLAERYGARNIFASAILLFTVASVLCGMSDSLTQFTLSRILQGFGGALMVPVGRMVILRVTEKKDIIKIIALITWPGLIAPVLGPPLGGFIVTYGQWPWIFWLNIPLGLLTVIATYYLVPQLKNVEVRRLDVRGYLYTSAAFTTLIIALECLGQAEFLSGIILLTTGVLCAFKTYNHSLRYPNPLLPFSTLRIDTFRNTIVGGSLFRASINAIPFLLPLLFQLTFNWSAAQAGGMVLWVFAGNLAMKPATTWLMKRWGFKRVLIVNGTISFVSMLSLLFINPGLDYYVIALILFIGGLSRSLQFSCYNSVGFADIPQNKMSDASIIFSIFFQFSMSAGVAIAALLLRASMFWSGNVSLTHSNINVSFIGIAALIMLSLYDAFKLKSNAGLKILLK